MKEAGNFKGVGPSTTLAWPGWKQSDIAVKEDTARFETSRFKNCSVKCVLLYYPSTGTEFKSAFNVRYTDTVKEPPGYPVQNYPSGSFLS